MSVLLIQSCSESKRRVETRTPALDLYTGYFFNIIDKTMREGELRDDLLLRILSAEHGIVRPEERIGHYNRRMTADRARELNHDIIATIVSEVRDLEIGRVVVNVGTDYLPALESLESELGDELPVDYIEGKGIGVKGSRLKAFIRGKDQY